MATTPPTGTVSLVFTDIQGSTSLWEKQPGPMRAALAEHERVMRETIAAAGGYEVKTEGDAFMVAFRSCVDAVRWCLTAQTALAGAAWPEELLRDPLAAEETGVNGSPLWRGLRVRMGVHMGEPDCRIDPLTSRMDYFGPAVNRAARVSAAGHGGQVLVSERVWREIGRRLGDVDSPVAIDLGEHRLRDLETPERLTQVLLRYQLGGGSD